MLTRLEKFSSVCKAQLVNATRTTLRGECVEAWTMR